jgi:hypothetical protein
MVGFPYDDLPTWRAVYPPDVFIRQLDKVANGFDQGIAILRAASKSLIREAAPHHLRAWQEELSVAAAAAIHFHSTANQARFVQARQALSDLKTAAEANPHLRTLEQVLREEITLAQRLHKLQSQDSRLGFEASNQYYYVPTDLVEKVLNCQDLLTRWLPAIRTKWRQESRRD